MCVIKGKTAYEYKGNGDDNEDDGLSPYPLYTCMHAYLLLEAAVSLITP